MIQAIPGLASMVREGPADSWVQQEPFSCLPESAKHHLMRDAHLQRYPVGAVLFREGEPAKKLYLIQSGWVQLTKKIPGARTPLTLDLVTPKDGLCGLTAFIGGCYMATAVAVTPVNAVLLPASALQPLIQRHAELAAEIAQLLGRRYRHTVRAYANAFAPVEQRIAAALLRLREDFGSSLPVTRREVAEMTGTAVETAIRITRQMERQGILEMSRRQIVLLRPEMLAQKAGQPNGLPAALEE